MSTPGRDAARAIPHIRSALVSDATPLARLHASIFDEPWPDDIMHALVQWPEGLCLVATAGTSEPFPILGFAFARVAADEAELLSIGVAVEAQRGGIASVLLQHLVVLLQPRGVTSLFLEVADDNAAARALYERHGFVEVGRRRGYYVRKDRKTDAIVMRRDLSQAG